MAIGEKGPPQSETRKVDLRNVIAWESTHIMNHSIFYIIGVIVVIVVILKFVGLW